MISRGVKEFVELFDRAQEFSTTPGQNGWTITDTSSAGTPTYLCVTEDGGAAALTLAANSEVENVCLSFNDVLPWDLAQLKRVDFIAMLTGMDANTSLVLGVGSGRNDTLDSVAVNAWFRVEGASGTLTLETDDGTNDTDDVASGTTLAAVYKKLSIDFSFGLKDVRFYVDGERVAADTTFDISAITEGQNVQPLIQLQKTTGTGTPSVRIAKVAAQYNYAYGE